MFRRVNYSLRGGYSYPRQLENILNTAYGSKKFSVINKGIPGTNTTGILATLEDNLEKYKPDLVVTMMGINDTHGTMIYEDTAEVKTKLFLRSFRVYKLARLLREHILYQINQLKRKREGKIREGNVVLTVRPAGREEGEMEQQNAVDSKLEDANACVARGDWYLEWDRWEKSIPLYRKALELEPDNVRVMVKLGVCYREVRRYAEAERTFERAAEIKPRDALCHVEWGCSYKDQRIWKKAEAKLKQALQIDPGRTRVNVELEDLYLKQKRWEEAGSAARKAMELDPELNVNRYGHYLQMARDYHKAGKYKEAEGIYKKMIEIYPQNDLAYAELGRFYNWRERRDEAIAMCKKTIEINPRNDMAYAELGVLYAARGDWKTGEEMYKKAFEIRPKNNFAFSQLVTQYMKSGAYKKVEEMCQKVIETDPKNDRAWGALALCCEKKGDNRLAHKYLKKANELRARQFNPVTAKNYQMLKDILQRKGIRLVCLQYPMRPLGHLQRMFEDRSGVVFVDNEKIFKEAVGRESYNQYFEDNFAGDFGHCTRKGNRLLAENIAGRVLEKIFGVYYPETKSLVKSE